MKRYLKWIILLVLITRVNIAFAFILDKSDSTWQNSYDVKFYKLDIHATDSLAYIWGNTTIFVRILKSFSDTFIFDLGNNIDIDSIWIEGVLHNFIRVDEIVKVPILNKVKLDSLLAIQIFYRGQTNGSTFFSSFSSKVDKEWKIPVTWTLSEPFGAKSWFPCKQSLTDKADSATIIITVPKHLKAGSNGLLKRVTTLKNSMIRYEWETKYPIAYYLISFCISDYTEYSFYAPVNKKDSVLVQNYIYNRPDFLEKNKENIDATSDFIRVFSELFGDYPFKNEKYGHCIAPMGGGMEHQTMTTLSNFGYDLISHELAHQWFGDLVTCSSWQDIWVNEGFASYAEYLAIEKLKSKNKATEWMKKAHSYAMRYPDGTVNVPLEYCNNEYRIFNYYLTYKKGAAIIHTLRDEINNDSVFFSIIREYLSVYAFKTASVKDFIKILNQKTGQNFQWFFDQWFYGAGFPQIEILWRSENGLLTIDSRQVNSENQNSLFLFNYKIKVSTAKGDTLFRLFQNKPVQQFSFKIAEDTPINLDVNPDFAVLMDINEVKNVPYLPTLDNFFIATRELNSNNLIIHFTTSLTEKVLIQIVDYNGEPLLERTIRKGNKIIINTDLFEKNNYLLRLMTKKGVYIRKIRKQ